MRYDPNYIEEYKRPCPSCKRRQEYYTHETSKGKLIMRCKLCHTEIPKYSIEKAADEFMRHNFEKMYHRLLRDLKKGKICARRGYE